MNLRADPGRNRPQLHAGSISLLVIAFVALVSFSAFEATFALFGERRLGFRLASTGAVFAGIGLGIALVQTTLVHPAVKRWGERGTLWRGLLCNAGGLVVLGVTHSWPVLVVALVGLVVGQGLAGPSISAVVAGRASEDRRGAALGIQQAAGGLARAVGPTAGGLVFQHVAVPAPYLGGAVLMLAASAAAYVTLR